jgi:hypothetical protein
MSAPQGPQQPPQGLFQPQQDPQLAKAAKGDTVQQFGGSLLAGGLGMIGANLSQNTDNPWYAYSMQRFGNELKDMLQQRWWKKQAEIFSDRVAKQYQQNLTAAQEEWNKATSPVRKKITDKEQIEHLKANAPPGSFDPMTNELIGLQRTDADGNVSVVAQGSEESFTMLQKANEKFFGTYQQLSTQVLDVASSKFATNPFINNMAAGIVERTAAFVDQVTKGPYEAAQQRGQYLQNQIGSETLRRLPPMEHVNEMRDLEKKGVLLDQDRTRAEIRRANAETDKFNRDNKPAPPEVSGGIPDFPVEGRLGAEAASHPEVRTAISAKADAYDAQGIGKDADAKRVLAAKTKGGGSKEGLAAAMDEAASGNYRATANWIAVELSKDPAFQGKVVTPAFVEISLALDGKLAGDNYYRSVEAGLKANGIEPTAENMEKYMKDPEWQATYIDKEGDRTIFVAHVDNKTRNEANLARLHDQLAEAEGELAGIVSYIKSDGISHDAEGKPRKSMTPEKRAKAKEAQAAKKKEIEDIRIKIKAADQVLKPPDPEKEKKDRKKSLHETGKLRAMSLFGPDE